MHGVRAEGEARRECAAKPSAKHMGAEGGLRWGRVGGMKLAGWDKVKPRSTDNQNQRHP